VPSSSRGDAQRNRNPGTQCNRSNCAISARAAFGPLVAHGRGRRRRTRRKRETAFTKRDTRDEVGTFTGIGAIEQWNTQAKATYHDTVEPLTVDAQHSEILVIGKVAGDFPGSPINLQHIFRIAGDKIVPLEIR
jgi:hypothetical protein